MPKQTGKSFQSDARRYRGASLSVVGSKDTMNGEFILSKAFQ